MALPNPWDYSEKNGNEHAHQAALFMWANMAVNFGLYVSNFKEAYTEAGWAMKNARGDLVEPLKWLFAVHNQGHGDAIRGGKAKAEGVKAGVADMMLPWPLYTDGYRSPGLFVELKVGKNQPDPKQIEFRDDMRRVGYNAEIAWGWLEARAIILKYLDLPTIPAISLTSG